MNDASLKSGGGTFCRFTVGSGKKGASARYLRYISHPQAVRTGHEGVWLQGFPPLLLEAPYPVLVQQLCDWAHGLEQEDLLRHRGAGETRTHYRVLLSFETSLPNLHVKSLLAAWMHLVFPRAQAAAFLHTNTRHPHLHLWMAARQTDGRKINLSARAFRQLDEIWNRIYSQALHRDAREHLLKKGQTERYKQLRREGKEIARPERVEHHWNPTEFNVCERQRLGADPYDRDETGVRGDQPPTARETSTIATGEQSAAFPEPDLAAETDRVQQALAAAEQTVSEVERLHQDAQSLAPREPEQALEAPRALAVQCREDGERER